MMRTFCLCLWMCLFAVAAKAQNKSHFRILENGVEVQNTGLHQAVSHFNLEPIRWIDARRQIPVEATSYTIELFSAQELKQVYGRGIRPQNQMSTSSPSPLSFVYTATQNTLKLSMP